MPCPKRARGAGRCRTECTPGACGTSRTRWWAAARCIGAAPVLRELPEGDVRRADRGTDGALPTACPGAATGGRSRRRGVDGLGRSSSSPLCAPRVDLGDRAEPPDALTVRGRGVLQVMGIDAFALRRRTRSGRVPRLPVRVAGPDQAGPSAAAESQGAERRRRRVRCGAGRGRCRSCSGPDGIGCYSVCSVGERRCVRRYGAGRTVGGAAA